MIKTRILKQLRERDQECWHCGTEGATLVPHHRKNRGHGGSKDRENDITNLILICSAWNTIIESDAERAHEARAKGHKLRSWQTTDTPVYHFGRGRWYRLEEDGTATDTLDRVLF